MSDAEIFDPVRIKSRMEEASRELADYRPLARPEECLAEGAFGGTYPPAAGERVAGRYHRGSGI